MQVPQNRKWKDGEHAVKVNVDRFCETVITHAITYQHSVRVAKTAQQLAEYMGISEHNKERLVKGCYLHDIGKSALPSELLEKKEALTSKDWNLIKHHPLDGARIAWENGFEDEVIEIILFHHERWDGTGYPFGLKETETPILSRICSVIDAFDSMVNDRSFRKGLGLQTALSELRNGASAQFDEQCVDTFIRWAENEWCILNKAGRK